MLNCENIHEGMIEIFDEIKSCVRCNLYKNQKPLLDNKKTCDVLWLGLSSKMVGDVEFDVPLSANTNSGIIIEQIESQHRKIDFYKSNLVKCLPLNDCNKLRYPTKNEMDTCFSNFKFELNILKPKIVFLLGEKVKKCVWGHIPIQNKEVTQNQTIYFWDNIRYIPIKHPSYIYVYKRKDIEKYKLEVSNMIRETIK